MSGITILNQANVPIGPFTREQVTEKLQKGEVTMSSLAFVEGLSQWTPLRDILARVDLAASTVRPPPMSAVPAPMAPAPAYSYAATMAPPSHLVYAGFWLRFVAYFIDGVVLSAFASAAMGIFLIILSPLLGTKAMAFPSTLSSNTNDPATVAIALVAEAIIWLFFFLLFWVYFAWLESSSWQATLGKKVLGLRVTGMTGERITFWHATGRYFAKCISTMILYLGFIMAGFTERKQALHDMIAGTLVVRS